MPRQSAFSCLPLFVCTALFQLPAERVWAQEAETPAVQYHIYTAPGWNLAVSLADSGTLSEAGDPGWTRDDLDWLWLSNEAEHWLHPVYQVDGGTIGRSTETPDGISMTDAEFDLFYEEMLASLASDPSLTIYESDPEHRTSDGRRWQMFHTGEYQDGGTADDESDDLWLSYYSYFTLDAGILRLVNFYYESWGEEDDDLTALDVMLSIDPDFTGDSYDQ